MGLDYSFKIYFKKEDIWNALSGVVKLATHHQLPVKIKFPDRDLLIPLDTWSGSDEEILCDSTEIYFATVLNFYYDDAIQKYMDRLGYEDVFRGPPDEDEKKVAIGIIYLTIYQKIPDNPDSDLVLFDFGTPGTTMSILFSESSSIRKTFLQFAEKFDAVCGLLNREESAEVFWINHQSVDFEIGDPYMSPEEISRLHNS